MPLIVDTSTLVKYRDKEEVSKQLDSTVRKSLLCLFLFSMFLDRKTFLRF